MTGIQEIRSPAVMAPLVPRATPEAGRRVPFRPDIEGLRAVAILLVVLHHAGTPWIPGGYVGVDVFFVISGFLITSLLVAELRARGTISFRHFYARRAVRLLPAATLVILTVMLAAWLAPGVRAHWYFVSIDALYSTAFGMNHRLIRMDADYFESAQRPSPFQHFWSLAVEEQFYLVWPVLFIVVSLSWLGSRRIAAIGRRGVAAVNTRAIATALVVLAGSSFALAIGLTGRYDSWAYFSAPARAWELALGAMVALGAPAAARLAPQAAAAMSWLGLAGVLTAAVLYGRTTPFPGYAALLPVVGTAMIIIGGCATPMGGAGVLLRTAVFQAIGRLSYGWYLWHWPVLIIVPVGLGIALGVWQNLALVGVAFGFAAISCAYVEKPIRTALRTKPWKGLTLGAGLAATTGILALVASQMTPTIVGPGRALDTAAEMSAATDAEHRLIEAIAVGARASVVPSNLTPPLTEAWYDHAVPFDDGCVVRRTTEVEPAGSCVYGDPTSATTVVLFGDSHAAHWFPAFNEVALDRGWRLVVFAKGSCSSASTYVVLHGVQYDECEQWRANSIEKIRAMGAATVVLSAADNGTPVGTVDGTAEADAAWIDGWRRTVQRLKVDGLKLKFISDTPRVRSDVADCVAMHLSSVRACHRDAAEALQAPQRRQAIAQAVTEEGAHVIDPFPWLCTSEICPVIVGNLLVFRDGHHLTPGYASLLAPLVEKQLL